MLYPALGKCTSSRANGMEMPDLSNAFKDSMECSVVIKKKLSRVCLGF